MTNAYDKWLTNLPEDEYNLYDEWENDPRQEYNPEEEEEYEHLYCKPSNSPTSDDQ